MNNNITSELEKTHRRTSLSAGLLYLLTFVSVPTLSLYGPVKSANYIMSNSSDSKAILGGLLEIIVGLAGISTAVVLYKVLKKQNETLSLGLVAARILEASSIFVGVSFLLSIVVLHKTGVGAEFMASSHVLAILYDRLFLLSQSFMPAICDLLLGYMLFRSRLVPRGLSVIGIIGGPVLIAGYLAVMLGFVDQHAKIAGLSSIFVALFELSLGVWLVVKGFNHKAVTALASNE